MQSLAATPRLSWLIMAVVTTMVVLSTTWVALTPAGDQTTLVDRTWEQFALQEPEVAYIVSRQLNVLGALGAGFGVLAALIAVIPYRRGERWAWFALWVFPITVGLISARQLVDNYPAGYFYAAITGAAIVGLLIPVRRFVLPDRSP